LLLLLVLSATWGASYLFISLSLAGGMSAPVVVFGRLAIGAAVLCALAYGRSRRPFAVLRGDWPRVAVFALFEMVLPYLLIAYGEGRIPSGTASLLVSTQMMWVVLLTPLMVRGARIRAVQAAGVGVGLVGVAALVQPFGAGTPDPVGAVLVTLAAASYATGSLLLGLLLPGREPLPVTAAAQAVAAVLVAPVAAVSLPRALPDAGSVGALAVLGVVCTAGGFLLFNTLITRSGTGTASLVAYLAPVFSLAYGALVLDEPFTVPAALGLLLIVAGSALTVPRRRRRVVEPAPAEATVPAEIVTYSPKA